MRRQAFFGKHYQEKSKYRGKGSMKGKSDKGKAPSHKATQISSPTPYLLALRTGDIPDEKSAFKILQNIIPDLVEAIVFVASSDCALVWQSTLTFIWRAFTTAFGVLVRSSG